MKKICLIICTFFVILGFASCKPKVKPTPKPQPKEYTITYNLDGGINNDKNPTKFTQGNEVTLHEPSKPNYRFIGWFFNGDKIEKIDKDISSNVELTAVWQYIKPVIVEPEKEIKIAINGRSEIRSGATISYTATVTGMEYNDTVTWSIEEGEEFATISENGELTASEVAGDKVIKLVATSNEDSKFKGERYITIVSKPSLTQEMLDKIALDVIGFEGYVNIHLYTKGQFSKLEDTYTTVIKTAMDGTNWYAEYLNGDTNTTMGLYYKNHNNIASVIGVSFMNDELYESMVDDDGNEVTWEDAGLYNSLKGLKVEDFKFNNETWRYEYVGTNPDLARKVLASANPYDFMVDGFSLIVEENEIMGIYAKSKKDPTIMEQYDAIQELIAAICYGETVEVPSITKYKREEIHAPLEEALENMHNLDSYKLNFKEITSSITTGFVTRGFSEIVTNDHCYFKNFEYTFDIQGTEIPKYGTNDAYGFKKINDNLYNSYTQNKENGKFSAVRAYEADFVNAKPSFAFAAEIFNQYVDKREDTEGDDAGTITYYVHDIMSPVASTFYNITGIDPDLSLYGLFATRGYVSTDSSFTPYVVVKDGYIIEAGFYFYVGYVYGVVELEYSEFNTAQIEEEVSFETRMVPLSWSEVEINVSSDTGSTKDDVPVNALEHLKEFFQNENIENDLPFFNKALGDTYGFGLTTRKIPAGGNTALAAIVFYYDVPLDVDYTIDSSLQKVEQLLLNEGFVKNKNNEFNKGNIWVAPVDSSLDLMIYVWKA